MVVPLGPQYNIGEKPTVMLYTYINRHVGTPDKTKQKHCRTSFNRLIIRIDNSTIESLRGRAYSLENTERYNIVLVKRSINTFTFHNKN